MPALNASPIHSYDFQHASQLGLYERFHCVAAQFEEELKGHKGNANQPYAPIPTTGFGPQELLQFELKVNRLLPEEYREFLRAYRYLAPGPGLVVWGQRKNGEVVGQRLYTLSGRRPGSEYLVFADYWHFGVGDHLMMDLLDDHNPVYLNPRRGQLEEIFFAPSFSLALCRLAGI